MTGRNAIPSTISRDFEILGRGQHPYQNPVGSMKPPVPPATKVAALGQPQPACLTCDYLYTVGYLGFSYALYPRLHHGARRDSNSQYETQE